MKRSDKHWEKFGKEEPYYWVTTRAKYHGHSIDQEKLREFFAEGENYRQILYETIRRYLTPDFAPIRILGFGCGVGRILLPMARHCESAVGLDISQPMLNKAIRHKRGAETGKYFICHLR